MVDMGKLDPDDPRPPSQQLAALLRAEIEDGTLGPGAQLPSYHALSKEYGVAPNTVKGALTALRSERLIVSRQGKGSYVRTRREATETPVDAGKLAQFEATLADLAQRLESVERQLGVR